MKKGFTLIELLAVIVILAIIALIATPIILNIIKDSKEEARERSIDNIIDTARIYATKEGLEENETVHIKDIKNMIDGEIPENGIIYFDKKGEVAFSLDFKDEVYVKSFEGEVEKESVQEKEEQISYLKVAIQTNGADQYYFEDELVKIKKSEIEKVTIVPTNKVPEKIKKQSWDVSEKGNGKVMAWYTDVDSNNLYEVYIGQEGGVKANPDSKKLFNDLQNVKEIDLTYLNTEYVTDSAGMFQYCYKLEKIIGLENFDTSKVTDMRYMFSNCRELKSLNVSKFVTNKVTNMLGMFQNCRNLKEIDVSSFITSEVTNMSLMFAGTLNREQGETDDSVKMLLERIKGVENFDTSEVTDMSGMFQKCLLLTTLDLRNWDTKNVTNMAHMFNKCGSLTILDLSNFDTRKIGTGPSDNPGSMRAMFQICTNLSTIYVTKEKWVRNIEFDITNMFYNTPAVVKDITNNEPIVW